MKIQDIIREPDTIEEFLQEMDKTLSKKGIILEAPEYTTPGGIVIPAGAKTAAPVPKPPAPPNPNAPAQSTRAQKKARIAAKKIKRSGGKKLSAKYASVMTKVRERMTLRDLYGNKVEKFIPKTAFKFMVVIKWLNMLPFLYEYWGARTAVNEMVASGEMSEADGSAAQRIVAEELVVKIVASAGFASLLTWLMRLRYLRYLAWAAGAVASTATLGLFGGPTIVAILATEAAALWLQSFLQSEKGREIVAWCVMYAIDPTVTWIWNQGPGRWFESLKAEQLSDKGKEQVGKISSGERNPNVKDKPTDNVGGKPSGSKSDVDASSSDPFAPTTPYDRSGKDVGWASTNKYMTRGSQGGFGR
jgi:hypothetical protein